MEFNLADLFECVAARVPDREVVVWGDTRLTYRQLDQRANRLAHGLEGLGLGAGDHVGVLTYSRPEYLETMVAAYKVRAVPININYRYVAEELAYLFDNAELRALVRRGELRPDRGLDPGPAPTPRPPDRGRRRFGPGDRAGPRPRLRGVSRRQLPLGRIRAPVLR